MLEHPLEPIHHNVIGNNKRDGLKTNRIGQSADLNVKYYEISYRINTKEGYVIGNVTSACRSCNVAKHEKTVDEFLLHIHKIYTFNSQRLEQLLVDSSESKQKVSILESDIV